MCTNMNKHTPEPDAQRIEGSAEPRHSMKVTVTLHEFAYSCVFISEIGERDLLSLGRIRKALRNCECYVPVVL